MAKRCEANPCFTASARSSKIGCWKCEKSFHLKCAGISGNQHKIIRDCSGAVWLCPLCLDSKDSADRNSPTLQLISDRLASIVRLVMSQIEVTRSLCRAYGQNLPRSSCCHHSPKISATNVVSNFEDQINNIEFSKIFDSFVADADQLVEKTSNKKRNRTSSCSSTHIATSRIGKRTRVDASVDASDFNPPMTAASFTVSEIDRRHNISTIDQREPLLDSIVEHHPTIVNAVVTSSQPLGIRPHRSTRSAASPSPRSCNATATYSTSNPEIGAPVPASSSSFTGNVPSCICPAEAGRDTTQLIRSSPIPDADLNQQRTATTINTLTSGINSCMDNGSGSRNNASIQHSSNTDAVCISNSICTPTATLPTLSVAPVAKRSDWFYLTRFLPTETTGNIALYISKRCSVEASKIRCHKLIRQNRDDDIPLTFISFKLSVPDSIVSVICSKNFWPRGVSISPFSNRKSSTNAVQLLPSRKDTAGSDQQLQSVAQQNAQSSQAVFLCLPPTPKAPQKLN